jgi:hypothetical protein
MPSGKLWKNELSAYHDITLKGIYGSYYLKEFGVTVVIYGAASIFDTTKGTEYSNYDSLKEELYKMIQGVKLVKVDKD